MIDRKWQRYVLSAAFLWGLVLLNSCSKDDDEPKVTKNEDIFINEVSASGDDWIELYNANTAEVNIGGYKVYDDGMNKYALPANTKIAANGFLVLYCDDTGVGLHPPFKLTSDGETVYFENASGDLIDKVKFPALRDGQSYGRFPDGSTTLLISGNTSEGESNGDNTAPVIVDVTRSPLVPALDQAVTITAKLLSASGIASVKLFYRVDGGSFTTVTMTGSGINYTGVIPANNATGKIEYYVEVTNNTSLTSTDPFDAPDELHDYLLNTDALPQLYINEFMAANASCCPDNDGGTAEYDDWIEIYNAGDTPVDIGGMYLSDNVNDPFGDKIPKSNPSKTTIPAKGFLVLWADGNQAQGILHLNFSLSASGEDVGLFYIDGRAIDTYTFGSQTDNTSYGRTTNGGVSWKSFASPTQGTSNE